MENYIYKIYRYFFHLFSYIGCHQFSQRSFFLKGYQFPLCSRCTGLILGFFLEMLFNKYFHYLLNNDLLIFYSILLMFPMFIDWIIQIKFKKESKNYLRFILGIFGGIGEMFILNIFFSINC